jgi:dolichol-phosphate mannosyltransferase
MPDDHVAIESEQQPEHRLVADLARSEDPELAPLRTSVAVGGYVLGRLSLEDASRVAGMAADRFERLVATRGDEAREPAAAAANEEGAPLLSVVVPVFDEEENLPALWRELSAALAELGTHEVLFVDDGSRDRSAEIILELRDRDPSVKLLRFSRNFGHQAALSAGLDHARGDAVVFMDADLQDPPQLLGELVRQWRAGHEVVYAVRRRRKEGGLKRLSYFAFYRLLQRLAEMDVPLDSGDFCLVDRRVADAIRALPERNRFLRGLRSWVGFRQVGVPYERPARFAGEVKYTLRRLAKLALDGLVAFSSVPLRLASYLGFVTAALGVAYTLFAVVHRFFTGAVPAGWTSIIAIILTMGGIQLIMTGVLGAYLARVYDETKGRPLYVVQAAHGFRPDA